MEVDSPLPGAPVLPLGGGFMPNDDAVQIRNIEGIGPVKSEIASTPFATGRGDLFQGSSTGKRNIVLTLGLNPNWADQTMMELRQILYRYFMPENWGTFRFISDELPTVFITGVVESVEPNIFSEDPEMQVSIICPKPDFIDVDTTLIHGTSSSVDQTSIEYIGTVPTGFELRVAGSVTLPNYSGLVTVANTVGPFSQTFKINGVLVNSGVYFKMNTVRSARELFNVFSDGSVANILEKMATDSTWPEFQSGENIFSVVTAAPGLHWTLGYFNRFGGL
jgi:hypothetical protein